MEHKDGRACKHAHATGVVGGVGSVNPFGAAVAEKSGADCGVQQVQYGDDDEHVRHVPVFCLRRTACAGVRVLRALCACMRHVACASAGTLRPFQTRMLNPWMQCAPLLQRNAKRSTFLTFSADATFDLDSILLHVLSPILFWFLGMGRL